MMRKQIHPPYKPKVKQGAMDTDNFDRTFTQELVVDTPVAPSALEVDMTADFDQFTFDASAASSRLAAAGKKGDDLEGFSDDGDD